MGLSALDPAGAALCVLFSDSPTIVERAAGEICGGRETVLFDDPDEVVALLVLSAMDSLVITPRSTFSWWAAFLSTAQNVTVARWSTRLSHERGCVPCADGGCEEVQREWMLPEWTLRG